MSLVYNPEDTFPFCYSSESAEKELEYIYHFKERDICPSRDPSRIYDDSTCWHEFDQFLFRFFEGKDTSVVSILDRISWLQGHSESGEWTFMLERFQLYFVILFVKRVWRSLDYLHSEKDIASWFENAYPWLALEVRNIGQIKSRGISHFFQSILASDSNVSVAMEHFWLSDEKEIFEDFGYHFCVKCIYEDPTLIHRITGIGVLGPAIIAEYTGKVVSVLGNSCRHWFMPFSFLDQPKIPPAKHMSMYIGHIPFLHRKMPVEKYRKFKNADEQVLACNNNNIHFLCEVTVLMIT